MTQNTTATEPKKSGKVAKNAGGAYTLTERPASPQAEAILSLTHELRTPMQIINVFINLMQTQLATGASYDELIRPLNNIRSASLTVAAILEHAEDYVDQLRVVLNSSPLTSIACLPLLQTMRDQHVPEAEHNRQQIGIAVTDNELHILANETHVQQIVHNLLTNAIKYAHKNSTITLGAQEGPDDTVEVFVRDTGPGIAKKHHKEIFKPYIQLKQHHGSKGSELGLAFVEQLATNNHGTVWVESGYRQGSTFWVRLPRSTQPNQQTLFN